MYTSLQEITSITDRAEDGLSENLPIFVLRQSALLCLYMYIVYKSFVPRINVIRHNEASSGQACSVGTAVRSDFRVIRFLFNRRFGLI